MTVDQLLKFTTQGGLNIKQNLPGPVQKIVDVMSKNPDAGVESNQYG
jgi:hypothetical protein